QCKEPFFGLEHSNGLAGCVLPSDQAFGRTGDGYCRRNLGSWIAAADQVRAWAGPELASPAASRLTAHGIAIWRSVVSLLALQISIDCKPHLRRGCHRTHAQPARLVSPRLYAVNTLQFRISPAAGGDCAARCLASVAFTAITCRRSGRVSCQDWLVDLRFCKHRIWALVLADCQRWGYSDSLFPALCHYGADFPAPLLPASSGQVIRRTRAPLAGHTPPTRREHSPAAALSYFLRLAEMERSKFDLRKSH